MNGESSGPTPRDAKRYRTIPDDELREFYVDQVELSSMLQVATRAGVPKTTLQSFIAGAKPHPRTKRALGLYCVAVRNIGVRADALEILTGGDRALKECVLRSLAEYQLAAGQQVPEWVALMQRDLKIA